MRLAWSAPLVLALVLLAPAVAACSLAGPVPAPGSFTLVPLDGGEALSVDVHKRMLGAMCELSNPHALGDGWFVWLEWDHDDATSRDLHALRLDDGTQRTWSGAATRHVETISVADGFALWYERGWTSVDATADHAFRKLELATGRVEDVPVPPANYASVVAGGSKFVVVERAPGVEFDPEEESKVGVYDATTQAWLHPPRAATELGLHRNPHAQLASDRWALFQPAQLLNLESGRVENHSLRDVWIIGIDGDAAYSWSTSAQDAPGLVRHDLPNGSSERLDVDVGAYVTNVQGGHAILGRYGRAPTPEPTWQSRDQGWSPRGIGVPDVWVPRDVVQGETVRLSVIEFSSRSATVEVIARGGEKVFESTVPLASQGTGKYGGVMWTVPRDLAPGAYEVRALGAAGEGTTVTTHVYEAPHLFASKHDGGPAPRLMLEAVGFDAAPVTATFIQGALKWEARWSDGKGEPGTRGGGDIHVTVPGADEPRRALGAGKGSESVIIQPHLVAEPGAPLRAWFNGTVDGKPRTLQLDWDAPPRDAGPLIVAASEATIHEPYEVILYGAHGTVTLELHGQTHTRLARDGFLQTMLTPTREGRTQLNVTGHDGNNGIIRLQHEVHVHPPPETSGGHGTPGAGVAIVALTLITVAAGIRRRGE